MQYFVNVKHLPTLVNNVDDRFHVLHFELSCQLKHLNVFIYISDIQHMLRSVIYLHSNSSFIISNTQNDIIKPYNRLYNIMLFNNILNQIVGKNAVVESKYEAHKILRLTSLDIVLDSLGNLPVYVWVQYNVSTSDHIFSTNLSYTLEWPQHLKPFQSIIKQLWKINGLV